MGIKHWFDPASAPVTVAAADPALSLIA